MSELYSIANEDNTERIGDVVFVHGLNGNALETWETPDQPDSYWPTWLAEDVPNLGVWSLDYEVSSSAWKGHTMPLVDRAINALALLAVHDVGQRPVVFITHSMGGSS